MNAHDHPHILVDFDKSLAYFEYEIWKNNPSYVGPPIPIMLQRVKNWLGQGVDVRIFTARANDQDNPHREAGVRAIEDWCVEHLGRLLPVVCCKSNATIEIWDDRAVQLEPNTGRRVDGVVDYVLPRAPK